MVPFVHIVLVALVNTMSDIGPQLRQPALAPLFEVPAAAYLHLTLFDGDGISTSSFSSYL